MSDGNRNKWLDDVIHGVFADTGHPYFHGNDPRQQRAVRALATVYNHRYPEANGTIVSTQEHPDGFETVDEAADYLARIGGGGAVG